MHHLYKESGVDLDKARQVKKIYEPIVKTTFNENTISPLGLFGGFYELKDYKNPVIVSSTDGVGTKLVLSNYLKKYHNLGQDIVCLLYTSPSPRDATLSGLPSCC
mgnify:CR=1 FL=1